MFLRVDLTPVPPTVSLEEPGDCTVFHVVVVGVDDPRLVFGALVDAAAGRLEGDDAYVAVDAVRRMATGRIGPEWGREFEAMLDSARGKGWIDEAGAAIRAHVEWPG